MRSGILLAGVLVASMLFSCQNQENSLKIGRANKTFGKIPALCLAEVKEQCRLNKELEQTTDPQKLTNYGAMQLEVAAVIQRRLDEEFAKIKGREVPFELSGELPYRVLSGEVTGWEYPSRSILVTFQVVPTDKAADPANATVADGPDSLNAYRFCYLKCVNRDGKVLAVGSVRITPAKDAAAGAGEPVWEGIYQCQLPNPLLHDFTHFSKIVFIPVSEFEVLNNQLKAEDQKACPVAQK